MVVEWSNSGMRGCYVFSFLMLRFFHFLLYFVPARNFNRNIKISFSPYHPELKYPIFRLGSLILIGKPELKLVYNGN